MQDFVHEFLKRRDGNKTPSESYLEKRPKPVLLPSEAFELSFAHGMEAVDARLFKEVLLEAAGSGYTYARFSFRYESHWKAFLACDTLLDAVLLPLKWDGVLGNALPLLTVDGDGQWIVELFPITAVPPEQTTTLTPRGVIAAILSSGLEVSDPPPEPTEH